MNLGSSKLKQINTNRPQLVHSNSKQSIAASDDYYSLTSDAASSVDGNHRGKRYETPPLRFYEVDSVEHAAASGLHSHGPAEESYRSRRISQYPVDHEASTSLLHRGTTTSDAIIGPTTPGLDDTPYIQFAIDQLTRDEEVTLSKRASGPLSSNPPALCPKAEYIPDEPAPAYSAQRTEPPVQIHKHSKDKSLSTDSTQSDGKILIPNFPLPPMRSQSPIPERPTSYGSENVLAPTEPAEATFSHPKLSYIPTILTPSSLTSIIICCLAMMIGVAVAAVWPLHHPGLYRYDGAGTGRYFVFQYLPQILGAFIIIWVLAIQRTLHRVYPFVALASGKGGGKVGVLYEMPLFPTASLLPNMAYLRNGGPWLTLWTLSSWLALFTVPLLSCLFQTQYFESEQAWKWTVVQPLAWIIFALYGQLIFGLVAILFRFASGNTGLKWDPTSIADIMAIFYRSNILNDFQRSEIESHAIRPSKDVRLGYWRDSRYDGEPFYCIADENEPIRRFSLQQGKIRPVNDQPLLDVEAQVPEFPYDSFRGNIHDASKRFRWIPWALRDKMVIVWIVVVYTLFAAFVLASFIGHTAQKGFSPRLPSLTSSIGFSPSDFLYSFVPSFIGMIFFLLWQPVDSYFRALQPFADLSHPRGCTAESSILLEYSAQLPVLVTLRALVNRHYKVALVSFNAIASITLPILAGGIFTSQYVSATGQVRVVPSLPGFQALVAFAGLYAVCTLCLFPTKKRHLPHAIKTLADLVSFFYQSPLLAEAAFERPVHKLDITTRLLARPANASTSARLAFGIYLGLDGREHLGIDRVRRATHSMLVDFPC